MHMPTLHLVPAPAPHVRGPNSPTTHKHKDRDADKGKQTGAPRPRTGTVPAPCTHVVRSVHSSTSTSSAAHARPARVANAGPPALLARVVLSACHGDVVERGGVYEASGGVEAVCCGGDRGGEGGAGAGGGTCDIGTCVVLRPGRNMGLGRARRCTWTWEDAEIRPPGVGWSTLNSASRFAGEKQFGLVFFFYNLR
jgi:hypothetical protein